MDLTRRRLCTALGAAALPIRAQAGAPILSLGLLPNLPVHRLVEIYQPLADYLTAQSGYSVRLVSSRDFITFYKRTHEQAFDLIITAPHLAWLAMTESAYRPVITFANQVAGVVIVKRYAAMKDVRDCRGKTVAMVDPLSIVNQLGVRYFKRMGLAENIDYQTIVYNNHANAALAVMIGDADCAVVGKLLFDQMVAELHTKLRVIGETAHVPSQFMMANARLPATLIEHIRTVLLAFNHTTPGINMMRLHHLVAITAAGDEKLEAIKPYALATRSILRQHLK